MLKFQDNSRQFVSVASFQVDTGGLLKRNLREKFDVFKRLLAEVPS